MPGLLEQLKTITAPNEILEMDEREFRALFGISPTAFVKFLPTFVESAAELKQEQEATRKSPRKRRAGAGRKPTLRSAASQFAFILQYFKRYATLDDLADRTGFHRTNASRNLNWLLDVLLHALAKLNVLPARKFETPAALHEFFKGIEDIVIDATERPILRPQDSGEQKEAYSGKKHQHSVKNTVISTLRRQILFLGQTVFGSHHDYGLFKTEFSPGQDWFAPFKVWIDLGYLGFANDFVTLELNIPYKKPRKSATNPTPSLTDSQKEENHRISSVRIVVEHVLASIKHWSILSAKFRNRIDQMEDRVILAAAGLHNFLLNA